MGMPIISKVFGALDDTLELPCSLGEQWFSIQVIGSGTLTLQLQDSYDGGATYVGIAVLLLSTGVFSSTITAAGLYNSQIAELAVRPRLRCTAFTSGTLTAFVTSIERSLGLGGRFPMVTQLFDGAGQSVSLPAADGADQIMGLQVTGAGTLTFQLQNSLDGGATYHGMQVANMTTGSPNVDVTAAGLYAIQRPLLLVRPRLAVTAFTSGSLTARYIGGHRGA